ncbi:MAG TPA: hypothetical protein VFW44_17135 [Bryobacteraceae bacterium]|nr:hypothetical protein [Bryobacteraceae bacterium]
MTRHRNLLSWIGFVIVIAAVVSYIPLFAVFPATRDVPWVNYLLLVLGGLVLAAGVRRAYRDPERYRGKVSGVVLAMLSVVLAGIFVYGVTFASKAIPASESALRAGKAAPSFTLADAAGNQVSSSDLLKNHRAVVLVFYRGYW